MMPGCWQFAALWTPARLADVGHITGAQCQFCGGRDTVFHRLWQCPGIAGIRSEIAGDAPTQAVIHAAYEDGTEIDTLELYAAATRALIPKPACPPKSTADDYCFQAYQGGLWIEQNHRIFCFDKGQPVYTDGVCGQHAVISLWGTGCAAI